MSPESEAPSLFEKRKEDHLTLGLRPEVQAIGRSGFDEIHLTHEALPELDFAEVDLRTPCLGSSLAAPFFISGMTAGHPGAAALNSELACACDVRGWAFGVGSQRRELNARELSGEWTSLRKRHPKLLLIANLGLSQAIQASTDSVRRLIDSAEANAIAIHLNALQEAMQAEGTPHFKGGLAAIDRLCRELPVPVIVKETGCGFSRATLERLASVGAHAVDVSGFGGTHWGRIEGLRAPGGSERERASLTFANWGESTVDSLIAAGRSLPASVSLWASGGVRSGLDAARALALGAQMVGYAHPALAAVRAEKLEQWMKQQEFELRVALFCTGARTPEHLRKKENAWARVPTRR